MDTELYTLRSRFVTVYDNDILKSNLQDILLFDKKGYKIISVLGSVKKFQGFVECSVLDTRECLKEFVEKYGRKNDQTIRMLTPKYPKAKNVHRKSICFRCHHRTRYQKTMNAKEVLEKTPHIFYYGVFNIMQVWRWFFDKRNA